MGLTAHIQAVKDAAAREGQTDLLTLAMLNIIEELAEQVADLSTALDRHVGLHLPPPPQ
jgi:hypothetical protein